MKPTILLILLMIAMSQAFSGDVLRVEDLISARKFLGDKAILTTLEQQLSQRAITLVLQEEDFARLKQEGCSDDFLQQLRAILKKHAIPVQPSVPLKYCQIKVEIQPGDKAGKVIITPAPDAGGKLPEGSEVSLWPQAGAGYIFDHWDGGVSGYYPLKFKLNRALQVIAVFQKNSKLSAQDSPPKIENPKEFKEIRKAGHCYKSQVVGVVEGRGDNKDWIVACEVDYKYVYTLRYSSEVSSNDGYHIHERRTFDSVEEMLLISDQRFKLDVREDTKWLFAFCKNLGNAMFLVGDPNVKAWGKAIYLTTELTDIALRQAERIKFDRKLVETVFNSLEGAFGANEHFKKFKDSVLNTDLGKILGYPPQMKMLEGKTFKLYYADGVGLEDVDVEDGTLITAREKELFHRAFYLSDYYIFRDQQDPKKVIGPGDTWKVDARTLAGVLDPRARHKVQGTIQLKRGEDQPGGGQPVATFDLIEGSVSLLSREDGKKVQGNMAFTKGKIFYDLNKQYVTHATLFGIANYQEISTDHLLFGTRLLSEPRISMEYKCDCTKQDK